MDMMDFLDIYMAQYFPDIPRALTALAEWLFF